MIRDTALTMALESAKREQAIFVIYQTSGLDWEITAYEPTKDLSDYAVSSTRYVLPHGEVTKLS